MNGFNIYERLEFVASKGFVTTRLRLWKSQIKKLKQEGFTVVKIKKTNRLNEWYCNIKWKNPSTKNGMAAEMLAIAIDALADNL